MSRKKVNPVTAGDPTKNEIVQPIKKSSDVKKLKNYWINGSHKTGVRDWMLFKLGIITGLRASDVVRLKWYQVYDLDNHPRTYIYDEKDRKTGKINHYLYIKQAWPDLINYSNWLHRFVNPSIYLFPKLTDHRNHLTPHTLYRIIRGAGDKIGLHHIGSHTMRKTFGYMAYKQTGNITYVMRRLNQSSPQVTLRYIGIDKQSMENISSKLRFNF